MLPTVFNFGVQQLRTIVKDGEPWFVAKDVCDILEIVNNRDAVFRLDQDEKGVVLTDTPGGQQEMQAVNEFGLYSLVLGSRKPEAKQFKRWITHEVIPSIRKTGTYSLNQNLSPQLQLLITMELKQKELEQATTEIKEAQYQIATAVVDHTFALSSLEQKVTNEITLTTREQAQIQGAVTARVTKLGDRSLYPKLYSALKRHFGVPSYRDLKRSDLTRAFEFIKCWRVG